MKEITINIHNNGNVSDKDILRIVRNAINYSIKYDCDRTLNEHHYWFEKQVEMQITYK